MSTNETAYMDHGSSQSASAFRKIFLREFTNEFSRKNQSEPSEGAHTSMANTLNTYADNFRRTLNASDMTLTPDFDDEDFLTSRAMYHCWSDRPRGRHSSNRRPGRRRSAGKPSSHHSLARR